MQRIVKKTKTAGKERSKDAHSSQCFWVNNGPICRNIKELRDALSTMSDEQFDYHTKRDGNDFVRWIRDVLGMKECAGKVARAKTRAGALRALAGVK